MESVSGCKSSFTQSKLNDSWTSSLRLPPISHCASEIFKRRLQRSSPHVEAIKCMISMASVKLVSAALRPSSRSRQGSWPARSCDQAGGVAVHCCDEADARQVLSLSLNYGAALLTLQAAVGWGLAANGSAIRLMKTGEQVWNPRAGRSRQVLNETLYDREFFVDTDENGLFKVYQPACPIGSETMPD